MIPFKPVIEPRHVGAFITEDPSISVRQGRLADIPWMTGITSEEGTLKVAGESNTLEFPARESREDLRDSIILEFTIIKEQRRIIFIRNVYKILKIIFLE